jgi:replicative DNA helicase
VLFDQIMQRLAEAGLNCHSYINEMSESERVDRSMARISGVEFERIYARNLDAQEESHLRKMAGRLRVGLTECAGWTAPEIARHIRWNRWDVAGLDILHEIPHKDERDLAEIAQVLRSTAKSVGCALIAAVHLNDNRVTTPQHPRPVLRDVRGSGMLIRGADVVLFVHRDEDGDGTPKAAGMLSAAKVRNGKPASMGVVFQPHHMQFVPASREVDRPVAAGRADTW